MNLLQKKLNQNYGYYDTQQYIHFYDLAVILMKNVYLPKIHFYYKRQNTDTPYKLSDDLINVRLKDNGLSNT